MPDAKHQTVVNSIELTILFSFIYIQLLNLKNNTEVLKGEVSSFLLFTLNYATCLKIKAKPMLAYLHSLIIVVLLTGV